MGRQDNKNKHQSYSGGSFADAFLQAGKISKDDLNKQENKPDYSKNNYNRNSNSNSGKSDYNNYKRSSNDNYSKPNKYNDRKGIENNELAKAPYNFIPLNEKVVSYKDAPDNDIYYSKSSEYKNTGFIECEIETITPLYIRDITEEKNINKDEKSINSDFYSPSKKLTIPGSSLRGMTRTLVEIMSFSRFGFVDDKYLYFRGLADRSNLRNYYQNKMSSYDKNSKKSNYKMSSGVLVREGLNYYIIPAKEFKNIPKDSKSDKGIIGSKDKITKSGQVYKEFNYYFIDNVYIVVSGNMNNKKNDWQVFLPLKEQEKFPIPEIDVREYLGDSNRGVNVPNLIKKSDEFYKTENKYIPCFYSKWKDTKGNDRVSFGHTPMFRLSYEKSIKDHIPENHKNDNITDLTLSIFGKESKFATRVFFEDSFIKEGQTDLLTQESFPKILSNPKPTTFQHYLSQSGNEIKNLNHYGINSNIRGYKQYWHKSGNNWEETNKENINKHQTQYTKIKAVKPNKKFTGKIRFENLSDIELGALLQALNLPQGCYHKLGMGKPLGLGTVKINTKLYLSDRKERYTNLFSNPEKPQTEQETKQIIETFNKFIVNELGEKCSYWDIERLKELKIMLDFERGRKLEEKGKTEYMELGSFKNRSVLPLPSKVE